MEELAPESARLNYKSLAKQFSVRHFPLGQDEKQLDVWLEKPLEKLKLVNNTSQTFTHRFLVILVLATLSPPQSHFPSPTPCPPLKHITVFLQGTYHYQELSYLSVCCLSSHQNVS